MSSSVQQIVKSAFAKAIKKAFPRIGANVEAEIIPANPKFGDYQCNNAMGLFSEFKTEPAVIADAKNPKMVADKIEAGLEKEGLFEKVTVAPMGFITVKLSTEWLNAQAQKALQSGFVMKGGLKKRVLVDFSSPNIAKEMHAGHLRSTIIGDSVCRMLEFCGHEVERLNHVGDWGTQFGMLIEYTFAEYPDFMTNTPDISDLQSFYKKAKAKFDADEAFKKKSQERVVSLQRGDKAARDAWQSICDISRLSFERVYGRLDIQLTERGESYYNDMIGPLIGELEERGLVEDSQGAKVIKTKVSPVPLMVRKSDGGFGYDSTDMAAIYHRLVCARADQVIYITDKGQETHFFSVFEAARMAGWARTGAARLDHMGFGLVLGPDGKKFKTRSGETVKLTDLLDQAVLQSKNELIARNAFTQISATYKKGTPKEPNADYDMFENLFTDLKIATKEKIDDKFDDKDAPVGELVVARKRSTNKKDYDEEKKEYKFLEPEEVILVGGKAVIKKTGAPADLAKLETYAHNGQPKIMESGKACSIEDAQQLAAKQHGGTNVMSYQQIVAKYTQMSGKSIKPAEYDLDEAADVIGHAAVKYFDLRQNRINDYAFDYNKILDPKGDTAVYLLYNYARICSIMRTTGVDLSKLDMRDLTLDHAEERALAVELLKFPDMIDRSLDELMLNQLCNYLYNVVSQFSGPFYQKCPVAKVDNGKVVGFNANRVLLCELTRTVLEQGFSLLGFKPLEVM